MVDRRITSLVAEALTDTPVVFLTGARQTGKSTLVRQLFERTPGSRYLTLDDLSTLSSARADPQALARADGAPLIIDEIQRAPDLLISIKAEVDNDRRPGRFLITGSANVLTLPKVSESLAGRVDIQTLWPFSQGELLDVRENFVERVFAAEDLSADRVDKSGTDLWERVAAGGYPEAVSRAIPRRRTAWFESYLSTIIQRDIRELAEIDGLTQIPTLLRLIAARSAGLLNASDLSRALQIPQTSLKRYLSLLETVYLVHRLPPWHGNLTSRLTKAPKVMLGDTGLVSYLMGADAARLASDHTLAGPILETFVVNEIRKQATWSALRCNLFHFRTHEGQEVDIVLEDAQGRCVGIEVKATAHAIAHDARGLHFLRQSLGDRFLRGIVLYAGAAVVPFGDRVTAAPIESLWQG